MVVMCSRNTAWGTDSNIRNLGAGRKTLPQLGSSPGFGPHRLLDDYVPRYGHPHSNGTGHVLTNVNGKQFVKIPSERVWKLQRRRRQEVEIKECVHDGSEVLTENQQADTIDHTRHTTEAQDRTRQPHRRWGCVTPEVIHRTSQTQPCQRCRKHESKFRRVCQACRRKIGFDCRPEACWIKARNMCRDCLPRDEDQASA